MIEHTDKCKQAKTANAASRANWLAKWPKHCPRCEGTGGQGMEDDICTCLDEGYCPRCGYHAPTLQPFVWIGGMIADLGTTLFRRFALYPRISSPWKRKANRAMHQLGIRLQNLGWAINQRFDLAYRFCSEPTPCRRCGWNWGKNSGDICPPVWDWPCDCELDAWQSQYNPNI